VLYIQGKELPALNGTTLLFIPQDEPLQQIPSVYIRTTIPHYVHIGPAQFDWHHNGGVDGLQELIKTKSFLNREKH
jgi:hypothetical protein